MSERAHLQPEATGDAAESYGRTFWSNEHVKFTEPHYRLQKIARIVSKLAWGRECALLDVGCGPGTLGGILPKNVRYFGIDLAISEPAPNLLEADLCKAPIGFNDMRFDIVVAQGVFEYLGDAQSSKFAEIAHILRANGKFVVTYCNFGHRKPNMYSAFSNVQALDSFRADLARHFVIEKFFPASHNWRHIGPNRPVTRRLNMHVNVRLPLVSPRLAVEYVFICSPRPSQEATYQ